VCGWHAVTVPFTVGKAALDRYAAGLEPDVALDLRSALAWFGADEEGRDVCVSRHDLQQFVHYTLPRKFLVGVEEHIAIARALGDALEGLGAPQAYADLCRSPETLALLRLWDVDEDAAFAQFAALTDASGLEPPDVDELQWRGVMGMIEAQTRDAATLELERALESGDRRPAAEIVRPCSPSLTRRVFTPRGSRRFRPSGSTAGRAGGTRRGARCSSHCSASWSGCGRPSGRLTTCSTGCSTRRRPAWR
jgi:hypothetical protein